MAARIEVAGQLGGGESNNAGRFALRWMRSSATGILLTSLDHRVSQLSLILRVSGTIWKFEGYPIENVKFGRDRSYISVDLLIGIPDWEGRTPQQIAEVLAGRVRRIADVLEPACQKRKVALDHDRLSTEMDVYAQRIVEASQAEV